nr:MAG TPA: tail protein [Caudoviricetes sp.]
MAKVITAMGKGGSSTPRQPKEMPDNLISKDRIKLLLALADGEVVDDFSMKQVMFGGVPVQNEDGSFNYPDVVAEFRPGTQTQDFIQGFTQSSSEVTVARDVKANQPYTLTVTNKNLSAIRFRLLWPRVLQQKDNGDMVGSKVEYAVDMAVDGGAFSEILRDNIDGKNTTGGYDRSIRVNLPQDFSSQVLLRVRRITPDADGVKTVDAFKVQSYAEVIDARFRYPMTALLYVEFDSDLFENNIPTISIKKKWKIIQVPSNYDPISREYRGTWDGTFKWAWSNNPAWVLYDLISNQRYGLDQRELGIPVDKWSLYEVAQYCDQKVPDNKGGEEPRYLCDMVVQDQVEAYRLIRDVCSIFRGMSFYNGESISIVVDKPRNPTYLFTNDNVIDGYFGYVFASEKSMYTTVNVMFDDEENAYTQDVEPVYDAAASLRFGHNPTEITAIGCVRRTEANRRGRWILKTNLRSETINFATGLQGMIPTCGDVIQVLDAHYQSNFGLVLNGRLASASGFNVNLAMKTDAKAGDFIIVNKPDGSPVKRTIASVSSDGLKLTLNVGFGFDVKPDAVFAIERTDLAMKMYVVTSIEKGSDSEEFQYNISAVEYHPGKYDEIDYGVITDERPTSIVEPDSMPAPENVTISSFSRVVQGLSLETMVVGWSKVRYASVYEMQWRKDGGNWLNTPRTATTETQVEGIYSGAYEVRVRSINAGGVASPWSDIVAKQLTGKVGKPKAPLSIIASTDEVLGIRVKWAMPEGSGDTAYIELHQSPNGKDETATLLTMVPYPASEYWHSTLMSGQVVWYKARAVDRIGNVSDWTEFARGMATDDVDKIMDTIKIEIEGTEGYKELARDIFEANERIDEAEQSIANVDANAKQGIADAKKDAADAKSRAEEVNTAAQKGIDEAKAAAKTADDKATQVGVDAQKGLAEANAKTEQVRKDAEAGIAGAKADAKAAKDEALRVEQKADKGIAEAKADAKAARDEALRVEGEADKGIAEAKADAQAAKDEALRVEAKADKGISEAKADAKAASDEAKAAGDKASQAIGDAQTAIDESIKNAGNIDALGNAVIENAQSQSEMYIHFEKENGDRKAEYDQAVVMIVNETEARVEQVERLRVEIDDSISASNTELKQAIATETEARATQMNQLTATMNGKFEATDKQWREAVANEEQSRVSAIGEMKAQVDKDIAATSKTLTEAIATETEARIQAISELEAKIGDGIEADLTEVKKLITDEKQARVEADRQLEAKFDKGINDANAKITANEKAIATETEARTEQYNQLKATVDSNKKATDASITRLDTAIATETDARVKQYNELKATVDKNDKDINAKVDASVKTLTEAIATEEAARVKQYNELNAKVDDNKRATDAAISELSEVVATDREASASKITELTASVNAVAEGVVENALANEKTSRESAAGIKEVREVIANETEARAEMMTQLQSSFDAEIGKVNASVTSLSQTISDESGARAKQYEELKSEINGVNETVFANYNVLSEAISTEEQARVKQYEELNAKLESGQGDSEAAISNLREAIAAEEQARVKAVSDLDATMKSEFGKTNANVQTVSDALAEETKARAQQYTELNGKISATDKEIAAQVKRLDEVIATETEARVTQYDQLKATVDSNKKTSDANYQENKTAIANETQARTKAVSDLSATMNSELGKTNANVKTVSDALAEETRVRAQQYTELNGKINQAGVDNAAQIKRLDEALATETEARTTQYNNLSAKVDKNDADVNKKIDASVKQLTEAIATEEAARIKQYNELKATVDSNKKEVDAAITEMNEVIATEKEATASKITDLTASMGANGEAALENALANDQESRRREAQYRNVVQVIANETESRVSQMESLTASFVASEARTQGEITNLQEVITNDKEANAKQFTEITARFERAENQTFANYQVLNQAIATETEARVKQYEELKAEINDDIQAEISNLQQAITDETQARTQAIQSLDSKFSTEIGKTNASVKTVSDALATEKDSTAQRFTQVNAKVDGLDKTTTASVKRLDEAIANEKEARTTQYNSLSATVDKNNTDINKKVDDNDTSINTKVDANFKQLNQAIADETQARTQAVTRLETSIGDNKSAIEQKLDSWTDTNTVGAMYGVKLGIRYQGREYATGMNMQLVGSGGNVKSQLLFQADRFAIMDANNDGKYPFIVDGGQVYMQNALIRDGSITNAKIGNDITSRNWVQGSQGWGINKDGYAEFNNAVFRGHIEARSGTFKGTLQADAFIGDIAVARAYDSLPFRRNQTVTRNIYYQNRGYGMTVELSCTLLLESRGTGQNLGYRVDVTFRVGGQEVVRTVAIDGNNGFTGTMAHELRFTANLDADYNNVSCEITARGRDAAFDYSAEVTNIVAKAFRTNSNSFT